MHACVCVRGIAIALGHALRPAARCAGGPAHSVWLTARVACLFRLRPVPSGPAAVYFAVIKTMEGSPELILATLQSKFVPTLAANYVIWPIAHLINFRFVPSE